MDIPIKFKFFDKLRLYQDYLKESSMLEKTKSDYWLYEKAVLYWAYSQGHQHLGRPLNAKVFCADIERVNTLPQIVDKLAKNASHTMWVKNNIRSEPAARHAVAILATLGFVNVVSRYTKENVGDMAFLNFPREVCFNDKGFLLGELLFETYENPGFWPKNFRKYKLALLAFYTTFIVLFLTVFLVFLNQLLLIIKPDGFVKIGVYIGKLLGYSWWSIITTCFLIYLGLKQVWKRL